MDALNLLLFFFFTLLTVSSSFSQECPRSVITVVGGGRTANCLWEYLTLYFASKYLPNKQTPYSQKFIYQYLEPIFDNVSLPFVEDIPEYCECCKDVDWRVPNTRIGSFDPPKNAERHMRNVTGNIILPKCVVFVEPVVRNLREIKQVLPYKKHLVGKAQKTLSRIQEDFYRKTHITDVTFVGVHIRRTDYIPLLKEYNLSIAGLDFYQSALDYFRNRTDLGRPIFVVASDDLVWVEENLSAPDVYVSSDGNQKSPGEDMVLLSYCNHSIADYGTFGMWAAIYTEGEVVTILQKGYQFELNLSHNPKWHFVDLSKDRIVIP